MSTLELVLSWLDMSQYLDRFIHAGFDSWEVLMEITEKDLEILGVGIGYRRKLQKEIKKAKVRVQNIAPPQPSPFQSPSEPYFGALPVETDGAMGTKKRAYKHHPKSDPHAPKRPNSAYVLFNNYVREETKNDNLSFSELSKIVGQRWQALSEEERNRWKQMNAGDWQDFRKNTAEYAKTQNYRDHQRYIEDFKTSQEAKNLQQITSFPHANINSSHISVPHSPVVAIAPPKQYQSTYNLDSQAGHGHHKESKVAIKRLKKDEASWSSRVQTSTAKQACEPCRKGRTKCHKEQPVCRDCKEKGLECIYEYGIRESKKTQMGSLHEKVRVYESLLSRLAPVVSGADQKAIQDALALPPHIDKSRDELRGNTRPSSGSPTRRRPSRSDSEISGFGSMGSTEHVNQEEFIRSGAEGDVPAFAGQVSDTKWLQRLKSELVKDGHSARSMHQGRGSKSSSSAGNDTKLVDGVGNSASYAEDMDTSIVGDQLYPLDLPLKETADALLVAYFNSVQLSFPILNQAQILRQYTDLYDTRDTAKYGDRIFIALLQIVFAIGATQAHLIQAEWAGHQRDHMLHFANARTLAVDNGILNDECSIAQVQFFGLAAMYLLITDQMNRAWNANGLAIRSAQSLGLHLKNVTPSMSSEAKKINADLWFAVTAFESMLVITTGRPSMVNEEDCSVSLLPSSLAEDGVSASPATSSNTPQSRESSLQGFATTPSFTRHSSSSISAASSLPAPRLSEQSSNPTVIGSSPTVQIFFKQYTTLCMLAKDVARGLYHPRIRSNQWADIQAMISTYSQRLAQWRTALPPPFNNASTSQDPSVEGCRVALGILFHSTLTLIHRPSLCRYEQRMPNQSHSTKTASRASAHKCVESAQHVIDLILNKPESTLLKYGASWWMLLHHMKRAVTVLLLELAFRAEHMPEEADEILTAAKGAIEWLRHIANTSPTTRQTWITLSNLLYHAAQRVGRDPADVVATPQDATLYPQRNPQQKTQHQITHQQPYQNYGPDTTMTDSFQTQIPQQQYQQQQQAPPPGIYTPYDPISFFHQQQQANIYGTFLSSQIQGAQYLNDLATANEWDQFGFLRAEGGTGSFFPQQD